MYDCACVFIVLSVAVRKNVLEPVGRCKKIIIFSSSHPHLCIKLMYFFLVDSSSTCELY